MPIIDIRTHADHNNAGYSPDADASLVILFDYVDDTEPDDPAIMQAFLYPFGRSLDEPVYCESDHDVAPGAPIIDIPDRTFCFMCPEHFRLGSLELHAACD